MARTHGKNVNFSVNGIAIEDELQNARIRFAVPPADITAFADTWGTSLAGKKSTTIEIAGFLDQALSQGDATILGLIGGGSVSSVLDLTGSGPGANAPEYQCTASGLTGTLLRRYRVSLPVGGAATYEAEFQNSGSTTRAVA